jgi:hypothetical protein
MGLLVDRGKLIEPLRRQALLENGLDALQGAGVLVARSAGRRVGLSLIDVGKRDALAGGGQTPVAERRRDKFI